MSEISIQTTIKRELSPMDHIYRNRIAALEKELERSVKKDYFDICSGVLRGLLAFTGHRDTKDTILWTSVGTYPAIVNMSSCSYLKWNSSLAPVAAAVTVQEICSGVISGTKLLSNSRTSMVSSWKRCQFLDMVHVVSIPRPHMKVSRELGFRDYVPQMLPDPSSVCLESQVLPVFVIFSTPFTVLSWYSLFFLLRHWSATFQCLEYTFETQRCVSLTFHKKKMGTFKYVQDSLHCDCSIITTCCLKFALWLHNGPLITIDEMIVAYLR